MLQQLISKILHWYTFKFSRDKLVRYLEYRVDTYNELKDSGPIELDNPYLTISIIDSLMQVYKLNNKMYNYVMIKTIDDYVDGLANIEKGKIGYSLSEIIRKHVVSIK